MSMELPNEDNSATRPPLLDGTIYPYWKAKMRAFLKSIDERIWQAIINVWNPPIIITGKKTISKDISEWNRTDYKNCGCNNKEINAL